MNKKEKDLKVYTVEEALKKIKETKKAKFDATVEVHINYNTETKKGEQNIRYTTTLPNGTGKTKRVAVLASQKVPNADLELTEADLDKIEKGSIKPKVDFEVFVSEPRYMPKIAKVAKILGPVGMMPNPKTGTVSENVEEAVNQIKKGKIEVRSEKDIPVIHTIIGKVSFEDEKLKENLKEVISSLKQNKPAKAKPDWINTVYLNATMGPSFIVDINSF